MSDNSTAVTNPQTRREPSDIDVGGVALMLGGLAAFVFLSVLSLGLIFGDAIHYRDTRLTTLPPEPRLQTNPPAELRRFEAEAAQQLASYGWVDRQHGIARIPVAEAMQRLAEQGIADWPGAPR